MIGLGAIAGIASKVIPIASKVVGALPVVSKIAKGIGSLFGKKAKKVTDKVSGAADTISQAAPQVARAGKNIFSTGRQMFDTGRQMFNTGRQMVGGMRDAFRQRDFGGAMNRFSQGMQTMGGQSGQFMRQAGTMGRAVGGMRDAVSPMLPRRRMGMGRGGY